MPSTASHGGRSRGRTANYLGNFVETAEDSLLPAQENEFDRSRTDREGAACNKRDDKFDSFSMDGLALRHQKYSDPQPRHQSTSLNAKYDESIK